MLMAKKQQTDAELEAFKKKALEEKAEDAESKEEEAEEEEEESEEEEAEESSNEDVEKLQKEHEEALTQERERREKAERALAERRYKEDKQKRREESGEEFEEDKPLTASELKAILAAERQATQKEILSAQIKEKAKALSTSEAEANLIMEIHKNRNFPSYLSIDEQVEEAYAIANRKRLLAQNEELKRALRSKETKKTDTTGTYKPTPKPGEPKLAPHDRAAMKDFTWDGKYFTKKLSNGKTLYKDWKSKKTFVR